MQQKELIYWLAFSQTSIFRSKNFRLFKKNFACLKDFWQASSKLLSEQKIPESIIQNFIKQRKTICPDNEFEKIQKHNIKIILSTEQNYSPLLKEIYKPPLLLFYKGEVNNLQKNSLAIVGTRNCSSYGKATAIKFTQQTIQNNLIPLSGMALGIDSLIHLTCTNNKTPTIAVLGSGLDSQNIYPRSNFHLSQKILETGGLLISEYPPETEPQKHHFPARNRLISGLSLGTLIIEANQKSGALITAYSALEQNREVFAVPGSILQPTSFGTNNLIKKGAKIATCFQDILDELNLPLINCNLQAKKSFPDDEQEIQILKILKSGPKHINQIAQTCKQSINQINTKLLLLEMKGKVKDLGQMNYIINI